MRRKKLAIAMALAMALTALPAEGMAVYAEDFSDGVTAELTTEDIPGELAGFSEENFADGEDFVSEDDLALDENTKAPNAFNTDVDDEIIVENDTIGIGVKPHGTAVMEAKAKSAYGTLTYQWQIIDANDADKWINLEDADSTSASYEVKDVVKVQDYRCVISNGKKTATIEFTVWIDTGFKCDTDMRIVANKGETVVLDTKASTEFGPLTFQWQTGTSLTAMMDIPGENGPTLTLENVQKNGVYQCKVADPYNSAISFFILRVVEKNTETCQHNMVVKVDKEATCAVPGSQHRECTLCGEKEEATIIPATGKHSFGEYTVTKAPTVLAAGVKTRTCKVCGKTETAAVAKLNGTIKVVSAKVPLQLKKKVALSKLVTGFTTGDSINAAACTSSKPSIAAISGGNVVAKKAGTTVITVKLASGASAQVTVVVQKKAVATSSITVPSTVNLTTGEKLKLTPVVSPVTSLNKVSYTSTNKKVATVTKNGVITAKKSGTATIKVKAGKKTKNVKVKVAKKAPTGMTGVPATKTLKKGKSFTIKAKLTPSGAEATIKYSSSNKKIATVNSKGKVTAKKAGTVTITVKAGNVTKTCVVTVKK